MSGFVYIWMDRKHNRYYIGSHWGNENDGYICSSSWMKQAYNRRSCDFKRRIIAKVTTNKNDLLDEENKWLSFIKDREIGFRYYNLRNKTYKHWWANEESKKIIGAKISKKLKGKTGRKMSQEQKDYLSRLYTGRPISQEQKNKISATLTGKPGSKRTKEQKIAFSKLSKKMHNNKIGGMHGKKHSVETLNLMSANNAMKNEKYRNKIGEANRGTRMLILNNERKIAKPNSQKWNDLISKGFRPKVCV